MPANVTKGPIELADQIKCVKRELAMRRASYPKWVASGRMSAEAADTEIARMEAVQHTLEAVLEYRATR